MPTVPPTKRAQNQKLFQLSPVPQLSLSLSLSYSNPPLSATPRSPRELSRRSTSASDGRAPKANGSLALSGANSSSMRRPNVGSDALPGLAPRGTLKYSIARVELSSDEYPASSEASTLVLKQRITK